MPKIAAPTVKEHHAMVKAQLVEAAERILRETGPSGLTASSVATAVGIKRNSIYRYVDSVEDLKLLALEQHIPRWGEAIFQHIDLDATPEEQLVEFAKASLLQSKRASHGWLMKLMGEGGNPRQRAATMGNVTDVHRRIDAFILQCWERIGVDHADLWAAYTRAVIFEAFKQMEHGLDADIVADTMGVGIYAVVKAARERSAA
ncbi:TetR/AcrR family transcriptional regulator [Arcanobacterium haemolyticum]|nr:TetR/AcrR family transcriptional regulator [Arcanobacterium haemolyticum]